MPNELLSQAAKYRAVALTWQPGLTGKQDAAYYFARAAELEARASLLGELVKPPAPEPTEPAPAAAMVEPGLKNQTKIHQKLALAVLQDSRPGTQRAFAMWLTLRERGKVWHYASDIIAFFADKTGSDKRNVSRWLDAGQDIFWTFGHKNGKRTVSLFGKNKVFSLYHLDKTGRVFYVDTSKLVGKLQDLRASLYALWIDKNSRWAARSTIARITGVEPRTQQNYDAANSQVKQKTFAIDWHSEGGNKARQLPNRYAAKWYPAYYKQDNGQRFNLFTPDYKTVTSAQPGVENLSPSCSNETVGVKVNKPQRVLFDNANSALRAVATRAKQGQTGQVFSVLDVSKRGNVLLKTYDLALRV